MNCNCTVGTCREFGFSGRRADICAGRVLTADACDVYRKHWREARDREQGDVRYSPLPCIHRGEVLRQLACDMCGERGVMKDVYTCTAYGECTERKVEYRQKHETLAICFGCPLKTIAPAAE